MQRAADVETALLEWEQRNGAAVETDADMVRERDVWQRAGLVPCAARLGPFAQHEAKNGGLSGYSDQWHDLRAKDWYSGEAHYALAVSRGDADSFAFDFTDCADCQRTFHGTTFKSLINILKAGGLVAGPNGHTFRGRHYKGVFQSAYLGEAFQRSDPGQGMDERGVVHPCAMPCALELRVSDLHRFHKSRRDLYVTPGEEGQLLRIIRIVRVHFNWRYVRNFSALTSEHARYVMRADMPHKHGLTKLCGGGSPSFGTCGALIPEHWWLRGAWRQSRNGYVYCPYCAKRVMDESRLVE